MRDHVPDSPGRRAAAYWFADGFPEILFGASLGLDAIAGLLWCWYVPGRARDAYFLVLSAGFLLYLWTERRILDFLKSRFTYPRTGYAQPPEEWEPGRLGNYSITLSLSPKAQSQANQNVTFFRQRTVMIVFWFSYLTWNSRWNSRNPHYLHGLVPILMLALAIALYVVNRKSEHRYSWWSTLILALLGSLFLLVSIPAPFAALLALLLAGGWLAAQGLATLVGYLRANPQTPGGLQA
jgi:hypothetical protein